MNDTKIVVCGSIAIDRIMNFNGSYKNLIKPEAIHVLSLSVFLDTIKDTEGGVAGNICYNLALLQEKPVLMGSVGKNAISYISKLTKMSINTKNIHYSNKNTASFNVITDADNNQIGGFYPGAMLDSNNLSFAPWQNKNVLMVLGPHDPAAMKKQVAECKKYGLRLFYDIGQQISNTPKQDIKDGINAAELVIVNDYEFMVLCDILQKTAAQTKKLIPTLVITKGSKGSIICGSKYSSEIIVKAAKPNKVLDPTGAGDAYRAGFLYGYTRGLKADICGMLGSVLALYALESHGTQEHSFTRQQFSDRFKQNYKLIAPLQ